LAPFTVSLATRKLLSYVQPTLPATFPDQVVDVTNSPS
jgi:hypothetical protein